jgi:hypothetical protein
MDQKQQSFGKDTDAATATITDTITTTPPFNAPFSSSSTKQYNSVLFL